MEASAEAEDTTREPRDRVPTQAVVALPEKFHGEPPRGSFWRRITQRARSSLAAPVGDDRVLARLDALEKSLGESIGQLDVRLSQVWEVEEQLSQLMDLQASLSEVRDRQSRLEVRARGIERRLSLLLLALGAGVAALLALLVLG
jgi:hypothetical protein